MNKIFTKAALAASISLFAFNATAVENASFNSTVTVQNAFTLTNDTPLNFGTLRANADTDNDTVATLVLSAIAAEQSTITNGTDATIAELVKGAPATFTVSGVSAFAFLTFNLDDAVGNITSVSPAPGGAAFFIVSAPSIRVLTGGNANTTLVLTDLDDPDGQLQVDGAGEATFSLGATLTTSENSTNSTTTDFIDGDYSGTFALTLEY